MAKGIHNIIDFSGGMSKDVDPRDIEENEAVDLDGFLSIHPGKLTVAGGFIDPLGMHPATYGFTGDNCEEGVGNLYYVNPSYSFKYSNKAAVAVADNVGTFTSAGSHPHGLSIGEVITIYNCLAPSAYDWRGKVYVVGSVTSATVFTCSGVPSGAAADTVYYSINGNYDSDPLYSHRTISPRKNLNDRYLFRAYRDSRFGFYNLSSSKTWFGSPESSGTGNTTRDTANYTGNYCGKDPWYFDLNYLWNSFQDNAKSEDRDLMLIHDVFYDNGVMRFIPESPQTWDFDRCIRPVGLYYIDNRVNFYDDVSHGYKINRGWYALRTHCFGPEDYKQNTLNHKDSFYKVAGKLGVDTNATGISTFETNTLSPTSAYQINVTLSHGDNGLEGDWQFASGGEHSKVGLGISYIYDDIETGQDSRISLLTDDGLPSGDNYVDMTTDSGGNSESLWVYWKIHRGSTFSSPEVDEVYSSSSSEAVAIDEVRGSGVNDGYGNFNAWNPRIVGANIWLTHTNEGPVEDPSLLVTINFSSDVDKHGISKAHNDKESTEWSIAISDARCSNQFIEGIPSIPVITYRMRNGFRSDENTFIWYKTSAIVNRRLYAGNVSYFNNSNPQLLDEKELIVNEPDRIVRSAVNKFDLLSPNNYLEVMSDDGQDIVKLVSFQGNLLIFKNDDLYVVDCLSEYEYIKDTKYNMGISNPLHAFKADKYAFWVNENGVFAYDGNEYFNFIKDKISPEEWKNRMFNNDAKIMFDAKKGLVLLLIKFNDNDFVQDSAAVNLLIIDIETAAIYFKSTTSNINVENYSQGINVGRDIYISNSQTGEEAFNNQLIASSGGVQAIGNVMWEFNNQIPSTTDDLYYPDYMPNTDCAYAWLHKASGGTGGWNRINTNSWILPSSTANAVNPTDLSNGITEAQLQSYGEQCANQFNSDVIFTNGDYNVNCAWHQSEKRFSFSIQAQETGSAHTLIPLYMPGYVQFGAPNFGGDIGGQTIMVFSSGTSLSTLSAGNISSEGLVQSLSPGIDGTASTFRITGDRYGSTASGIQYILKLSIAPLLFSLSYKLVYITGNSSNYFTTGTFLDETDGTASSAIRNDRLLNNIRLWLMDSRNFPEQQWFAIVSILKIETADTVKGTSGSKYFDIELQTDLQYDWTVNLVTSTQLGNVTGGLGSKLLNWTTEVPIDVEGNYRFFNTHVLYESKEMTFFTTKTSELSVQDSGPNVRKKIYKMYLTYTGGNDAINVYYKVNKASSWSDATVKDASVTQGSTVITNRLANATSLTRQEISFGSDASSVFSFAFKLESLGSVSNFEIHDISLVYRNKRVK